MRRNTTVSNHSESATTMKLWIRVSCCVGVIFGLPVFTEASFGFGVDSRSEEADHQQLLNIVKQMSSRMGDIPKLEANIDALWLQLGNLTKDKTTAPLIMLPTPGGQHFSDKASYENDDELNNSVEKLKYDVGSLRDDVEKLKKGVGSLSDDVEKKAEEEAVSTLYGEIENKLKEVQTKISDNEKALMDLSNRLDNTTVKNVKEDNSRRRRSISDSKGKTSLAEQQQIVSKVEDRETLEPCKRHELKMDQMENRIAQLESEMRELVKRCL